MKIRIKRAYDPISDQDGKRILIDRLWPRGLKKTDLQLYAWLKDVAPSTSLRKWFAHDPAKWTEFQKKYRAELENNPQPWTEILEISKRGTVTLMYGSREREHNHAVCLKDFLEKKLVKKH